MLPYLTLILISITGVFSSCATKEFVSCVVQLKSSQVQFDTNINNVIFNITTGARLIQTCRMYAKIFPCFEQRMATCGTKAQKQMLERGKRLHTYLCAPFALQRQRLFLESSPCIQQSLRGSINNQCDKPRGILRDKLDSCRELCAEDDNCHVRTDMSEIAACTFLKIEEKCGVGAANFFADIQRVITGKEYPVQCSYNIKEVTTRRPGPVKITLPTRRPLVSTTAKPHLPRRIPTKPGYRTLATIQYPHTSYVTATPRKAVFPNYRRLNIRPVVPDLVTVTTESPAPTTTTETSTTTTTPETKTTIPTTFSTTETVIPDEVITSTAYLITTEKPRTFAPEQPVDLPSKLTGIPVVEEISVIPDMTEGTTGAMPKAVEKPTPDPTLSQSTTTEPDLETTQSAAIFQRMPLKIGFDTKWLPWYYESRHLGGIPTNSMQAPVYEPTTTHATLIPPELPEVMRSDVSGYEFEYNGEATPVPFEINTNWMDDPEKSLWYQQTLPQQRGEHLDAFAIVEPLFNQLKTQPLNFTEMGNQATNYFNAALNALNTATNEQLQATQHNDPWRSIIDAVAPTIQRVHPDIIPRLRKEIDRIEQEPVDSTQ